MINTQLPIAVANLVKDRLLAADPTMRTHFIAKLQEVGLLAVGRVYARKKRERILFVADETDEKQADVTGKVTDMMDDLIEEQDETPTTGKDDWTLYFDVMREVR